MDQDAKKFFEELSRAPEENISLEPKIELAKSTNIPVKDKKNTKKESYFKEDSFSELMEEGEGQLTIDVYQTPDEIIVESTTAGVKPEDLDINITNESVTIKGKRERENKISDEDYFYQECYWGKFSRSIILPHEIDPENSVAVIKNGILTIRMPKLNRRKSRKINVKLD